ncbi:MAG TPA: sigma-70 family RNA polymerase sigma factor [Gemmatimonadaceae bacterium]|jgi:RNA polymerase sigma-70 factor (ECF subfamily)|nr:sigma-70 family RNA polymerase sigma factor [Gemmatimonadaceae bacterium]
MTAVALDQESAEWLRGLRADGPEREQTVERLHALLLRVARGEAARRRGTLPDRALEDVDDLCVQAASDALMGILDKLNTYRGAARFTTWAYKFAIYETSSRLRRHAWRQQKVEMDDTIWDRLPDTAVAPLQRLERNQLMAALERAIREQLTDRQRMIFQSVTAHDVPIDVLAERLASTRGAIYKTLHDARRKLRQALIEAGYGEELTV